MNRQCISHIVRLRRAAAREDGFHLAWALPLVIFCAGMLGLAVDIAHLYRKQLRLQRATDAAAVGAGGLVGRPSTSAQALDVARQLAAENLVLMGERPDLSRISSAYSVSDGTKMTVSGAIDAPSILLKLVPGMPRINSVDAHSSIISRPAVVSLVLDITGSMDEVTPAGSCGSVSSCRVNSGSTGGSSLCSAVGCSNTKFQKLRVAAKNFLNSFEEHYDAVALVPFASMAGYSTVARPSTSAWNSFAGHLSWETSSWWELPAQNVTRTMTDRFLGDNGTATDYRTVVDQFVTRPGTNQFAGLELGRQEILSYLASHPELDRARRAIVLITDGAPTVSRSIWNTSPEVKELTCGTGTPPPVSSCAIADVSANPLSPYLGCAYSIASDPTDEEALKATYLNSILSADLSRLHGITLYVVGIGDLGGTTPAADPYENISDGSSLKQNLLQRIANFRQTMPANGRDDFGCSVPTLATYNTPPAPGAQTPLLGTYQQVINPSDLDSVLQKIGQQIRGRLVE